ncbi:nSTAND1 domain-containing NTPase [Streptomyces sp. NPDC005151]
MTYRAMVKQAHYSAATLAQAASGDRLPSLAVSLAYAGACGGDLDDWERRWRQAAADAAEDTRADDTESPYLGLARFDTGDRDRFFGRDRLVDQLVNMVRRTHLVVLIGPSGSGKSSLLRAGLIPRLQEAEPQRARPAAIRILTPGPHPTRTHAALLGADNTRAGAVIVVDQFEEVFTLCTDPAEQTRFLDLLCTAGHPAHGQRVVIAVRADFFGRFTRHRPLAEAARDATLLVAPMSQDELREAIVKPAALGGLVVERALSARIIGDLTDEPGGLPLMSHALLETWRRRKGRALTEAAYDAAGGIHGAIAHTAEELYERLTPEQAETARRILMRLVTPGQGAQDTRRPTDRAELSAGHSGEAAVVLERLARARLITLDEDTVNLAHEALLTAWPRLREWIDKDRERLRAQRRLTDAAHGWAALGRDAGALYRGLSLTTAEQYFPEGDGDELTHLERAFLNRSVGARERARRRNRTRTATLSLFLVVTLLASLAAWQQNRAAERRRIEAEARRIASVAESLRPSDPVTAMRLGLAAWRIADLPETRSALLAASTQREQSVFTDPDGGRETMRRLSSDGRMLISVGAGQVSRWDLATQRRTATLPGLGKALGRAGGLRSDTLTLPVFTLDEAPGPFVLRDLSTGHDSGPLSRPAGAGVEMGPNGDRVLTYSTNRSVYVIQLWDAESRRLLLELREPREDNHIVGPSSAATRGHSTVRRLMRERRNGLLADAAFPDAAVSPDGRYLALCVPGRPLQLWDTARRHKLQTPWAPKVTLECVREHVRFTPDSRRLAVISDTGVSTWDIDSGRRMPTLAHAGVKEAAFSEDGTYLVASDGAAILLWRLAYPDRPVFRHPLTGERVTDLRVDPRAGWIRYIGGLVGAAGRTVRTLELGGATDSGWQTTPVLVAAFAPNGSALATSHPAADRKHVRFRLRQAQPGGRTVELPPTPCRIDGDVLELLPLCSPLMAFSSDGRTFAFGSSGYQASSRPLVSLWDVRRRRTLFSADVTRPHMAGVVAFGPGDRSLLVSELFSDGSSGTTEWDLHSRTLTRTIAGASGSLLALRPDGRLLVTGQGAVVELPSARTRSSAVGPGETSALAFSADRRQLAAGSSGRVTLWDGRAEHLLGTLTGLDAGPVNISALAFSPDARILAVATDTGILRLWDTASHRPVGLPLPTPGDALHTLAFSADGDTLYAAGEHVPLQTYPIGSDDAEAVVCRRVGRDLTPEEWRRYVPGALSRFEAGGCVSR